MCLVAVGTKVPTARCCMCGVCWCVYVVEEERIHVLESLITTLAVEPLDHIGHRNEAQVVEEFDTVREDFPATKTQRFGPPLNPSIVKVMSHIPCFCRYGSERSRAEKTLKFKPLRRRT